jgi:NitT/TauT family transport system substrate-binding protein
MPRNTRTASLLLAFGLALTACSSDEALPTASGEEGGDNCQGEKIKVAQSAPSFLYHPFYVAQGAGYLEEAGLQVEVVDLGGGANVTSAAVSGSVDVAMGAFSTLLNARAEGAPVVALGAVQTEYASNVVVKEALMAAAGVTAESPVEEKLALLEGLRLGVTQPGSGTDQLARYLTRAAGLDPDTDVTIVPTGGSAANVAAFVSGETDVVLTSSPTSDVAIDQGDGAYLFNLARGEFEPLSGILYMAAFAGERAVRDRPEVLQCFMIALTRGLDLIADDPAAAAEAGRGGYPKITDEVYAEAHEANIASYPEDAVIEREAAEHAVEFANELGGDIEETVLDELVNTDIAQRAERAVDAME